MPNPTPAPTMSVTQDGDELDCTVSISRELADDEKCLILLCVAYPNYDVYEGFEPISKWALGRLEVKFRSLRIDLPGEYMLCASVARGVGHPLLVYSDIVTIENALTSQVPVE